MKYKLIQIETDFQGKPTENVITSEFDAYTLGDMLMRMQDFLKGCGFVFDGTLDIVDEDVYTGDGHEGMGSTIEEYPEIAAEIAAQQSKNNVSGASSTAFDDQFVTRDEIEHSHYYWDTQRNR